MLEQNAKSIDEVTTAIANRRQAANEFTAFGNLVATSLAKMPSSAVYPVRTSILQFIGAEMPTIAPVPIETQPTVESQTPSTDQQ